MDAAMKPVQDELFRALFSHARANGDLRADVTVIALVDFAAQMAIASGMLWQDYPAPAHSSFSAALYDFANQLEAHRGARARSANDCDIARDAEPADHVLERDPQYLQWLTRHR
jgi:hypothetical protein